MKVLFSVQWTGVIVHFTWAHQVIYQLDATKFFKIHVLIFTDKNLNLTVRVSSVFKIVSSFQIWYQFMLLQLLSRSFVAIKMYRILLFVLICWNLVDFSILTNFQHKYSKGRWNTNIDEMAPFVEQLFCSIHLNLNPFLNFYTKWFCPKHTESLKRLEFSGSQETKNILCLLIDKDSLLRDKEILCLSIG